MGGHVVGERCFTCQAPPFTPAGDLDTNSTPPNLALHQAYIELDLFHYGVTKFSEEDFGRAELNAEDRYLIQFMADQEVGNAALITNIVWPENAAKPCKYSHPFESVRDLIDFSQKLTRFGESGVYGFLEHLNPRPSATLLVGPSGTYSYTISTNASDPKICGNFLLLPINKITGCIDCHTQFVAWISQLNTTYAPLTMTGVSAGTKVQPGGELLGNGSFPAINGTAFVMFTDDDSYVRRST